MMTRIVLGIAAMTLAFAGATASRADDYELVIITPHNDDIQAEFGQAFAKSLGRGVKIRWIFKPTGQLLQMLEATDKAAKGATFDMDVFFGGGVPDHETAGTRGFTEVPNIPADILAGIPAEIAGVQNIDDKRLWIGSALSSFGVLMNKRGLTTQNIKPIETWQDLARPELFSWVVVADPRRSSSVRVSYELILQQYGWESGWPMIMQIAANSRLITDSSSAIPNEVAKGDVLAGPCIDFYAAAQVAKAGADVLAYVNPAGGSAITPDPISLLRKAPHRAMGEKFIAFVLSPAGQALWALPPGVPGGPLSHALHRMPIRRDVCEQYAGKMIVLDPYKSADAGVFRKIDDKLQSARSVLISELIGASCVDLHGELKAAWKALIDGKMKPAALAEWNKLPFSEQDALALAKTLAEGGEREVRKITRAWVKDFKDKFERVVKLSK